MPSPTIAKLDPSIVPNFSTDIATSDNPFGSLSNAANAPPAPNANNPTPTAFIPSPTIDRLSPAI